MASIGMFVGGLVLGPVFAAQAGLAWYLVVGVVRFFGHWVAHLLPSLRWGIWPLLRTGYVLLLVLLTFTVASGRASGPEEHAQQLAALLGVAASFGVALHLRHRGSRWLNGESSGRGPTTAAAPPSSAAPQYAPPTWPLPPEPPAPPSTRPPSW